MQVIRAKYIVASHEEVLIDHCLVFEGKTITDIVPDHELQKKYPGHQVQEEGLNIIIPGFVNAHMHQYGVLSRGIFAPVSFNDFEGFLNHYWWPYIENRIQLEEIEMTTKVSAFELLASGVTAFCDTLEAPYSEKNSLIHQAKIIETLGMRAFVSLESSERAGIQNGYDCLKENEETILFCKNHLHLVQAMMCTHTSFTCSADFLTLARKQAKNLNAKWQFHLSESKYEPSYCEKHFQMRPVEYYDSLQLLDEDVIASQCVKVTQKEIEILAKRGVSVVHMPLSNCEVGGGFAPVVDMLREGICVGLGSDGYINNFFEVMRGAFLLHKAVLEDTSVMPAKTVFRMATEFGAKILGYENNGKIKPGYTADFVLLENGFKTPITSENIYDQIVVHGQKEFVKKVYVNGKIIYENKPQKDADLLQMMRKNAEKFWSFHPEEEKI